jgi:hypothetical protein
LCAVCLQKEGLYLLLGETNGSGVAKHIPNNRYNKNKETQKMFLMKQTDKQTNRFWLWNYLQSDLRLDFSFVTAFCYSNLLAVLPHLFFFQEATAPSGPGPPYYTSFKIIFRHTTVSRTPLDE